MLKKLSLQNRILALVSTVTILLMSVIVLFDSYSLRKSVEVTYVSQLDGMTTAINGRYEESHSVKDVQQIFDYIQYKNGNVLQLILYGEDKILASTDRELVGKPSPTDLLETLQHAENETLVAHIRNDADGIPKDRLTAPLKEDGVTIGAIELLVNTSESTDLIRNRTLFIIGVSVVIAALLLVALGFIIRKLLIRPLLKIREAAISVKQGAAYMEIKLNSSQEINEVASAFNEMVHNLEGRYCELQQAQKQLVESEKMVALGNLVAGVSHEINTPIGIGVTAVSYMDEKSKAFQALFQDSKMKRSDLEDYINTVRETTGMIQTNLFRASELIRSFKQIAVDRSIETKRRFMIKEYIKEVLISLQPNLKKTKHQVWVTGKEEVTLFSDPGAISQIVTNLIMNSLIHAFEPEDEGQITIDISSHYNELFLHYSDNGKGMPQHVVEQIFNPFFTTNRSGGGTGLGMHIVYNLVTQSLGGTIRCESKTGAGTDFIIQIPLMNEG
ncbi:sensor histidine kinase [Cohnella luojiensis]|uniref:histidine kinase n=1 Tax=Cohnella luojiensis TaxID=652876 RepID=A0A4Y8LPS3_9BACL|nr:HAMP domain-containing sensor histidine kinase [Cohnella luojiensis]TFE23320.1 HAMP domain-containing histidine kinase [Cohnella luojiensis]